MKFVKKTLALIITVTLLLFSNSYSIAAGGRCSGAPDKIHHYDAHRNLGSGYSEPAGSHKYRAYSESGIGILKTCNLTQTYYYCEKYCIYCNATLPGSRHAETGNIIHSAVHN